METLCQLDSGELQLLYLSPERLVGSSEQCRGIMPRLQARYAQRMLAFVVIDEAHCVSQWGLDFRESYRQLGCLRRRLPDVPILALTASATSRVEIDVTKNLHMRNPLYFHDTFDRPNIFLEVRDRCSEEDVASQIAGIVNISGTQETPDSRGANGSGRGRSKGCGRSAGVSRARPLCGIVYVLSRNDTKRCSEKLSKAGVKNAIYHAGLTQAARKKAHEAWMSGKCSVIVATVAFGMGIDKPDVRFVCHASMPSAVERYHQEIGRAGRDGGPCRSILFRGPLDLTRLKKMAQKRSEIQRIEEADRLFSDVQRCRRSALLEYFGDTSVRTCNACDVCWRAKLGTAPVTTQKDVTNAAGQVLNLVLDLEGHNLTAAKLRDIAKGHKLSDAGRGASKTLAQAASSHRLFGILQALTTQEIAEIIRSMEILQIVVVKKSMLGKKGRGKGKFRNSVMMLRSGPKSAQLQAGRLNVTITVTSRRPADGASSGRTGVSEKLAPASVTSAQVSSENFSVEQLQAGEPPAEPADARPQQKRRRISASSHPAPTIPQTISASSLGDECGGGGSDVAAPQADSGDELVIIGGPNKVDIHLDDVPLSRIADEMPLARSVGSLRVSQRTITTEGGDGDVSRGLPRAIRSSGVGLHQGESSNCAGVMATAKMGQNITDQLIRQPFREVRSSASIGLRAEPASGLSPRHCQGSVELTTASAPASDHVSTLASLKTAEDHASSSTTSPVTQRLTPSGQLPVSIRSEAFSVATSPLDDDEPLMSVPQVLTPAHAQVQRSAQQPSRAALRNQERLRAGMTGRRDVSSAPSSGVPAPAVLVRSSSLGIVGANAQSTTFENAHQPQVGALAPGSLSAFPIDLDDSAALT
eukprot:TRINITY_DN34474_c0_g1_i1.p1 TRINITY_DN34474_c0_g1~~TRINITY_DN34474_c0_g1_i1.p1  ORF type:complete len:893 (-),score=109.18 TRINITY_DN34474_c0_g1_i1:126-2735(-)